MTTSTWYLALSSPPRSDTSQIFGVHHHVHFIRFIWVISFNSLFFLFSVPHSAWRFRITEMWYEWRKKARHTAYYHMEERYCYQQMLPQTSDFYVVVLLRVHSSFHYICCTEKVKWSCFWGFGHLERIILRLYSHAGLRKCRTISMLPYLINGVKTWITIGSSQR